MVFFGAIRHSALSPEMRTCEFLSVFAPAFSPVGAVTASRRPRSPRGRPGSRGCGETGRIDRTALAKRRRPRAWTRRQHAGHDRNALVKQNLTAADLAEGCEIIAAGIVELIYLQQQGFAYIKL